MHRSIKSFAATLSAVSTKKLLTRITQSALGVLALTATGVSNVAHAAPGATPELFAQGRILIQPRAGASRAQVDKAIKAHGGRRSGELKAINVQIIELPSTANPKAVAQMMRKNPNLKFAEVDGALPPAYFPNDPQYSYAWHLPKISAPIAWDAAKGDDIIVAILDTGVDTTHPDLVDRLTNGWNFFDGNDDVTDVHGHGTAVAGAAAAASDNALGVTGVSLNSYIMPLRITDPQGYGYYSLMAQALITAADSGARVANISFLGVSMSSTVDSAAQYMRSKGGVVVVAGGNTGGLRNEPVSDAFTVVAATDSADVRASFSSTGDYIDIAAPGVSIRTTIRGGSYGGFSGTSAASPVTAGVYALMMSADPDASPAALDDALFDTAQDLGAAGWDQQYGFGRVNAAAAVNTLRGTPTIDNEAPWVEIVSPKGGAVSGVAAVDVDAGDNVGVVKVELYANGALVGTDTIAPYGYSLDTSIYSNESVSLEAVAEDAAGNSKSSGFVTVTVGDVGGGSDGGSGGGTGDGGSGDSGGDVIPPTVDITSPGDGATVSGTVTVRVSAGDDVEVARIVLLIDGSEVDVVYGSSLTYEWTIGGGKGGGKGGGNKTTSGNGNGRNKKTSSSGQSTLTAIATDSAGNMSTDRVTVTK